MKITTLNLQGFDQWEDREAAIITYLKEEAPDVALFQEAVYLPDISPYNQVQLLNSSLRYPYQQGVISRLQVGVDYPVYREGLAAISRHPIVSSDIIVLKQAEGDHHQRIVQLLDLYIDEQVVPIAHVHFSITDDFDFATPQLQELLGLMESRSEERLIMGDFNLNDLDASAELWQDRYVASTSFDYLSYPSMNKRNDYILVPKSYTLDKVTTSGDDLSDHRAITATVGLLDVRTAARKGRSLAQAPRN